ncbi:hypothetical protein PIB30_081892 [Stylosanthes scabra]|uniref:EF-hand domain-containing protein n=1 Tax=Stylosanthes scabra TaxID=79078 RepID=A0ABU6WV99_9FABA|nr:hypothetical protein [Stylosanthes scabra]
MAKLETLLTCLGALRAEEVATMLCEVDVEGRGCISVEELMSQVSSDDVTTMEEDKLWEAFEVFDNRGVSTKEKLHR